MQSKTVHIYARIGFEYYSGTQTIYVQNVNIDLT